MDYKRTPYKLGNVQLHFNQVSVGIGCHERNHKSRSATLIIGSQAKISFSMKMGPRGILKAHFNKVWPQMREGWKRMNECHTDTFTTEWMKSSLSRLLSKILQFENCESVDSNLKFQILGTFLNFLTLFRFSENCHIFRKC